MYRIPNQNNWPGELVNTIISSDALTALKSIPDDCISLIVTSPPYWNTIDYGSVPGQIGQTDYEKYLRDLLEVWLESLRILIPNGKLAIVTPILPISKSQINDQHTRHLKNISNDIEFSILTHIRGYSRFSFFVWQKQTTTKMFGSYPYPPNIYEDNTIEFINVFVKDGTPPPSPTANAKEASKITQLEWRNLTMQVWPMYPQDVKRAGGHPCPFPVVLPQRLIKMYTFQRAEGAGFDGDIVLDMFNGTGATCIAARALHRNWIGIDLNSQYCDVARYRVEHEPIDPDAIILEPVKVKSAKSSLQTQMLPIESDTELPILP